MGVWFSTEGLTVKSFALSLSLSNMNKLLAAIFEHHHHVCHLLSLAFVFLARHKIQISLNRSLLLAHDSLSLSLTCEMLMIQKKKKPATRSGLHAAPLLGNGCMEQCVSVFRAGIRELISDDAPLNF